MSLQLPSAQKLPQPSGALGVYTFVALLLGARRPSAIARLVVAVVVDSVQRVILRRSSAHVGQKSLERRPLLTHGNPAPTVIMVTGGIRVFAPLDHSGPRLKLRSPSAANGLAVCGLCGAALVLVIAAAALCRAAMEPCAHLDSLGAAIAAAKPMSARAFRRGPGNHRPAPEALSRGEVDRAGLNPFHPAFAPSAAATADAGALGPQFAAGGNTLPAAVTVAQPVPARARIVHWPRYDESVKTLAGQIDLRHALIITEVQRAAIA